MGSNSIQGMDIFMPLFCVCLVRPRWVQTPPALSCQLSATLVIADVGYARDRPEDETFESCCQVSSSDLRLILLTSSGLSSPTLSSCTLQGLLCPHSFLVSCSNPCFHSVLIILFILLLLSSWRSRFFHYLFILLFLYYFPFLVCLFFLPFFMSHPVTSIFVSIILCFKVLSHIASAFVSFLLSLYFSCFFSFLICFFPPFPFFIFLCLIYLFSFISFFSSLAVYILYLVPFLCLSSFLQCLYFFPFLSYSLLVVFHFILL